MFLSQSFKINQFALILKLITRSSTNWTQAAYVYKRSVYSEIMLLKTYCDI